MGRCGLLASSLLASMLATAGGRAEDATATGRMVQAFRQYCIDTDLTRFLAGIPKVPGDWKMGSEEDRWETRLMVPGDPHSRLTLSINWTNGIAHTCTVSAVWPEKSEIIRALAARMVLSEATSTLDERSEITSWTIRARGASAVVQLRVPTYAAEPGRSLTIHFGGSARTGPDVR
jgi:hypothetical protein